MPATNCTIIGVFDDAATAGRAADELKERGIAASNIEVTSASEWASDAARGGAGFSGERPDHSSGGGIAGFFRRLFGTDDRSDERDHYAEAVRRGSTVVVVRARDDEEDRVTNVLEQYDPVDIDRRAASWRQRGYSGYDPSARPYTSDEIADDRRQYADLSTGDERRIPVAQEEIEIDKHEVRRGGVRVYRHVHDEPVEQQVNLREEHVRVDRRHVDRPATEEDFRDAEEVVEFTETVEEPVIRKQARVVEEVVVGKDVDTRTESVRDTVRRTDVDVEQFGREGERYREGDRYGDDDFRRDFQTRYASERGASYNEYEPAYRYGYESANDPRYRGRNWDDVEDTIKTDYLRNHPTSSWDRMRGAVRYGWEKVTNKRP